MVTQQVCHSFYPFTKGPPLLECKVMAVTDGKALIYEMLTVQLYLWQTSLESMAYGAWCFGKSYVII